MTKKILQINKFYYPHLGGVETVVKDIAEELDSDNWLVDVLVCQSKGPRSVETIGNNKVYRAASFGKALGMPLSLDFFRLMKQLWKHYDIIIIHHPFPLAFLPLLFLPKKPLVIWYHCDIIRQKISKLFFLPFIHYGLKIANKIVVSTSRLTAFSPLLKKYKHKCQTIHFGLDLNHYQLTPEVALAAQKIKEHYSSDKKLLLSVGRLVYYKGYQYLIQAMTSIEAQLLIIGTGPEKEALASLIQDQHLENKITIIDPVDDLRPYYAACDLFILPSCASSEAFGLVQLEAMAFQKPVINTDLPTGVPEVSLNEETGLTVPLKDQQSLKQAIQKILNNEELSKLYGEKAKQRVSNLFNKENFKTELSQTLDQLE
ncbi:MAG TPA: glycosyltransferase [bacterium]|nr:glycosyltransferase [bacterium]